MERNDEERGMDLTYLLCVEGFREMKRSEERCERGEQERQKEAAEGGVESPEGGPRRLSKWELRNLPTCRAQRGG